MFCNAQYSATFAFFLFQGSFHLLTSSSYTSIFYTFKLFSVLIITVDPSADYVGVDSTGGVLQCQLVVYSQPSMVQYTHQVHKVVSFTVHIISNRQRLFIQLRDACQDRGGTPNRLTQVNVRRLMPTPDIGGCIQLERLLLVT